MRPSGPDHVAVGVGLAKPRAAERNRVNVYGRLRRCRFATESQRASLPDAAIVRPGWWVSTAKKNPPAWMFVVAANGHVEGLPLGRVGAIAAPIR